MKIKNFETVVTEIQSHLNDYLQEKGIDTSKLFNCINPEHPDKNPSCGTGGENQNLFHCFSRGCSGDIFKAAHYLENKPLIGKLFITDNLLYLAEKYNIKVEHTELTEDELYEIDTYQAYQLAHDLIIKDTDNEEFKGAIEFRKWTPQICKDFGVGYISSYKDFRETLKGYGFPASFLDDIDLNRRELFDEGHLVFTIKDEYGRPVGFSSRNLRYTEDKQNGAKYVNQKTTGVKCNIYKKGSRLYGFDRLLKKRIKKSDPIYIFEGYADVITAHLNGINNSVATGGTAFTIDQLQLLKDHGFYNIYLCWDSDEPGQKRTAEILDSTLGGHKDVKISIITVPSGKDPDEFIRLQGVEEFKKLVVRSAFEWRLLRFPEDTDPEVICQAMVPLIVNESSNVTQEKMINELAAHTGVSVKAIQGDVTRIQNSKEMEKERERQNIIEKLIRNIQRTPVEAEYLMNDAQNAIYELNRRYNQDDFSSEQCLQFLDAQKSFQESKNGEYMGFVLGSDLIGLQEALCGEWKKDVWLMVGGKANTGKTSLVNKIAYEIASHEENNALVIIHSIDDSADQVMPKQVCIAEGSRQLTINQVQDPNFHAKGKWEKTILDKRESGYTSLRDLIKNERIIIKDANNGSSIAYADKLIKYYKEKNPNRNIVYILDNFHKLQDFAGADERVRFKTLSTQIKSLATKHHITVISTVEYTKLPVGTKPSNTNVAESVQMEYDANVMIHLYNDLHEYNDVATHYHLHPASLGEEPIKMPRIEAIFGKNKVSGFKGQVWLDFYPHCSDWAYVDPTVPVADEEAKQENNKKRKTQSLTTHDIFGE